MLHWIWIGGARGVDENKKAKTAAADRSSNDGYYNPNPPCHETNETIIIIPIIVPAP